MRILLLIPAFLAASLAYSQQPADQTKIAKVKEELQKLWTGIQDASVKKDRKALENYYADEFLFIHSHGQEDDKQRRIDKILSVNDYVAAPMPSFDELYVYGDVAVLRAKGTDRGTTIFAKKNGQWQIVQVQSTTIPLQPKSVRLDPKILDQYVGRYEQSPGVFTLITKQGDTLFAKGMNRPQVMLVPISDSVFQVKDNIGVFTFYRNENRKVAHYILRVNERETKGTKVE